MRLRETYDVILGVGVVLIFLLIIAAAISYYKEYAAGTEAEAQIEKAQGVLSLGTEVTIYLFIAVVFIVAVAIMVYVFKKYMSV